RLGAHGARRAAGFPAQSQRAAATHAARPEAQSREKNGPKDGPKDGKKSEVTTLVWFRQDLRLRDNPALHAALKRGEPIVPVYVWSPADEGDWPPGAASRWWLHHSLRALDESLRERGSRLIVAQGRTQSVLGELVERTHATAVFWNRRYEPAARECSTRVKQA